MANGAAKVHIVDDDPSTRDSLKYLIESIGLEVRTYQSGQEFLQCGAFVNADCVVLDLRMPGMSGLELLYRLRELGVQLSVIILTGHGDVRTAVQALKNGACDFLQKPISDQVLLDRIQESMRLGLQRKAETASREELVNRFSKMTSRELQVVELIVAGDSTAQTAAKLGISPKTVEVHRANIKAKAKAGSFAELVRWAVLAGVSK